jgi:CheY-like chemotaxis protein
MPNSLMPLPMISTRSAAEIADDDRVSILIVDDRTDKLLALEAALDDLGENIVRATSGKEALRCLLHQDFSVILLDVNMPGMDGFETAALIRQRPRTELTPIIFVSAINDNENHVSRGYSLGAVDYISTPIIPEILRAKVSVFVDLFRKTAQIRRQGE